MININQLESVPFKNSIFFISIAICLKIRNSQPHVFNLTFATSSYLAGKASFLEVA